MTQTAAAIPRRLPRHKDALRQRGRIVLIILFTLAAIAGIVAGVVISLSAGNPAGAGLSIFYAFLPLPFLWWAYWWLDRVEPEPLRYKIAALIWGGVVAVAIALSLQILIQKTLDVSDARMASVVAPLTEEPAKCLFMLLTFLRARRVIDGFVDGIIYAGIIGIGFACVENIGYYAAAYLGSPDIKIAGAEGLTTIFIVRGIFSPFAHPLFTSAFGIAIGIAVAKRTKTAKIVIGAIGLAASMFLHSVWNASLSYGGVLGVLVTYLFLGFLLIVLAVASIIARFRQIRTLERSLREVSRRGWIHPAEVPFLARFNYRKAAQNYAKVNFGKNASKAVIRYQRLATEMGFLHDAMMRGRNKPRGVERTYALLDSMYALRPHLRLPPALSHQSHVR